MSICKDPLRIYHARYMEHFEIFIAPQRDPTVVLVSIKFGTNLEMYLGGAQQDIYILYECSKYTGCFQRLGRAIALKR